MSTAAPARVDNIERYWSEPPPERSPRCTWWVARIDAGWRRNRRLSAMGYYTSAAYFGVYIWEWCEVLWPMLRDGTAAQEAS